MKRRNDEFRADTVDEQIAQCLQPTDDAAPSSSTRTIQQLKHIYEEDSQRLDRVWERLAEHIQPQEEIEEPLFTRLSELQRNEDTRFTQMKQQTVRPRGYLIQRRLELLVAVLAAALIVGSMMTVFSLTRQHSAAHSVKEPASQSGSLTGSGTVIPQDPNSIYVSANGIVYKLDKRTGHQIWHYVLTSTYQVKTTLYTGEVRVADGLAFVEAYDGTVLALDANKGTLRWLQVMQDQLYQMNPQIVDNTLYVTAIQHVYALNPENGTILHTYAINAHTDPTGAQFALNTEIDGDILYVTSGNELWAFHLPDGTQIWYKQISADQELHPPHLIHGVLYVSSGTESQIAHIYAFAASTGDLLWRTKPMEGDILDVTVVNNIIYFGVIGGSFYAYHAQDGQPLWSWSEPYKFIQGSEASAQENAVQVDAGRVYFTFYKKPGYNPHGDPLSIASLDTASGKTQWMFTDPRHVPPHYLDPSYPFLDTIVQNGIVYAITIDGYSYALNAHGGIIWQTALGK